MDVEQQKVKDKEETENKMTTRKTTLKRKVRAKRNIVNDILAYEGGEMSEANMKKMFQNLVNTGQVWRLQGRYGRTAMAMLEAGVIKKPKKVAGKTKQNDNKKK